MASTACEILSMTIPCATVSIKGTAITVKVVEGTDVTKLVPTIALSAGATVDPAGGVPTDFTSSVTFTVTAEDATTQKQYTATVVFVPRVENLHFAGLFAARCVTGSLRNYTAGGMDLGFGSFKPMYVAGVQLSGGYIGYYDTETRLLHAYSASGTEASASADVKFSVFVFGTV